jgi:CheY-like chemotaxis protein
MPVMDGFQVAEAIKNEGASANTIMMLTSSNLSGDLTRAQEIGMGAYLVKPIKWAELLKAVHLALSRSALVVGDITGSFEVHPQKANRASILLVEDNIDNRVLVKAYLKNSPYQVDEADNGEVAVAKFKAGNYSLVLMDVQMPVMDGHEATQAIRAWEKEQQRKPTPIIALTAHAIKEDMDRSIAAGCTAHLTKPIKKITLIQAIQQFII